MFLLYMHLPDFGFKSLITVIDSVRRFRVGTNPSALHLEILAICVCFIPTGLNWNAEQRSLIPVLIPTNTQ
jgi:hypothetical protein